MGGETSLLNLKLGHDKDMEHVSIVIQSLFHMKGYDNIIRAQKAEAKLLWRMYNPWLPLKSWYGTQFKLPHETQNHPR